MKFIDMFCGMGTVRMGFERAGHECVYSIEWDKHKRRIYEVIFGNEPESSDICTVRGSDLPISDCWCFGAPCQDFSIAGLRSGLDGDRSSLVREVFRLVRETPEEHRPEWLLYENVKGMLSSNKGLDYLEILFEMASLGYDIQYELLNSKDFGVPQNRERVYTLGHSRRFGAREIFPIRPDDGDTVNASEPGKDLMYADCGVGHKWTERSSITPPLRSQGGGNAPGIVVIGKVNSSQDGFVLSADGISKTLTSGHFNAPKIQEPQVIQLGNVMPTATRDNPNQGRVYDPDGLAPCLNKMEGGGREPMIAQLKCVGSLKGCGSPWDARHESDCRVYSPEGISPALIKGEGGGLEPKALINTRIRRLTPRECMRLQGVPDYITDKLIAAGISDTQMYRAAGDACTVNVIYEIARAMAEQWAGQTEREAL